MVLAFTRCSDQKPSMVVTIQDGGQLNSMRKGCVTESSQEKFKSLAGKLIGWFNLYLFFSCFTKVLDTAQNALCLNLLHLNQTVHHNEFNCFTSNCLSK